MSICKHISIITTASKKRLMFVRLARQRECVCVCDRCFGGVRESPRRAARERWIAVGARGEHFDHTLFILTCDDCSEAPGTSLLLTEQFPATCELRNARVFYIFIGFKSAEDLDRFRLEDQTTSFRETRMPDSDAVWVVITTSFATKKPASSESVVFASQSFLKTDVCSRCFHGKSLNITLNLTATQFYTWIYRQGLACYYMSPNRRD